LRFEELLVQRADLALVPLQDDLALVPRRGPEADRRPTASPET
jgi:hypothetical protein